MRAIEQLALSIPPLRHAPPNTVLDVLRPYLAGGWCVRDITEALERGAQDEPGGVVWHPTEPWRVTLARIAARLRPWRVPERNTVLAGPWTERMRELQRRQTMQARQRDAQVHADAARRRAAAAAQNCDARRRVRELAAEAGRYGRRVRRDGELRAAAASVRRARQDPDGQPPAA